jgi:predicted DNA-binding transcriptional regulator YafY
VWGGEITVEPIDVIRSEARLHRTVVIDAFERDGTHETREIEPYSIRPGKSAPRLMFWCLVRNDMRSVLIPNIGSANPTGRSFVPRYEVEL